MFIHWSGRNSLETASSAFRGMAEERSWSISKSSGLPFELVEIVVSIDTFLVGVIIFSPERIWYAPVNALRISFGWIGRRVNSFATSRQ